MTIGKKIVVSFSIIILFILGIITVSWYSLENAKGETANIVDDAIPLSNAANNILTALVNQETGVRGYLVTGDESFLEPFYEGKEEVSQNLEIINTHLDGHPIMASLIDEAVPKIEDIQSFFDSEVALVQSGNIEQARENIGDGKEYFDSYRETHALIAEDTQKLTNDAWVRVNNVTTQSLITMLSITTVIILITVAITIILIRTISKPIRSVSTALNKIANGDLTLDKLRIKSKDEVGILASSLNKMIEDLSGTISKTHESTMQVAASSEQLTASAEQSTEANEQLASLVQSNYEGAEDQLKKINSVSSSLQEMVESMNKISDNSKEMESATISTNDQVDNGIKSIEEVVGKIHDIKSSFDKMNITIRSLNDHSNEIGNILNLITDISEQTNLLALNAAIEAARAGDHGKGFAVVANEVRILAEESKKSADQIGNMVRDMQSETQKVVISIDEGNVQVTEGIASTNAASGAFTNIQKAMSNVSDKVIDVTGSLQDIEEISVSITNELENVKEIAVSSVEANQESSAATQEQLATMEEISSSAESLSQLAEDLQGVISKFKVS
ncbi:methyl-accepting chemotaxis protein [Saliterribacillus persicus]|uniref:Methyl-accepting chemotaxis protein n=1 Tax=Saliterribacillus persicus TaxID=930114 RepID=A0A368X998_9BACI|nr:methyl-accepting chemotaxis protein [Saliterribacillus persicus]RCW64520.1 methyl-accepting chemotaxis protein [Saliterribacillus persicus]